MTSRICIIQTVMEPLQLSCNNSKHVVIQYFREGVCLYTNTSIAPMISPDVIIVNTDSGPLKVKTWKHSIVEPVDDSLSTKPDVVPDVVNTVKRPVVVPDVVEPVVVPEVVEPVDDQPHKRPFVPEVIGSVAQFTIPSESDDSDDSDSEKDAAQFREKMTREMLKARSAKSCHPRATDLIKAGTYSVMKHVCSSTYQIMYHEKPYMNYNFATSLVELRYGIDYCMVKCNNITTALNHLYKLVPEDLRFRLFSLIISYVPDTSVMLLTMKLLGKH